MRLTIAGSPLYSGELELDPYSLTFKERRRIKELTGLRGVEVMEAFLVEDPDIYFGLAVVALERTGEPIDVRMLEETEGLSIVADFSDEAKAEEEAGPKEEPANADASEKSESAKSGFSGGDS